MNFNVGLKEIEKNNLKHIYFICGKEKYLSQKLQEALTKKILGEENNDTNLTIFNNDVDLNELIATIETVPFFGGNKLVIVKQTSLFKPANKKGKNNKKQNKTAENFLMTSENTSTNLETKLENLFSKIPEDSYLVFISEDSPDKRLKVYKILEKHAAIIEVNPLKGWELKEWISNRLNNENLSFTYEAKEYFLLCLTLMPEISLDLINNEIEKISLYVDKQTKITLPILKNILAKLPETSIFTIVDSLAKKDLKETLNALNEQISTGTHPLQILAIMARQVRHILVTQELVNSGLDAKEIMKNLKLPEFVVKRLINESKIFSKKQLEKALVDISALDHNLKTGSASLAEFEQILIELCS
ncbi:DNA polymerase III subunit delta [Selenomonadales bacterium OttesenSCG-928-I06]|nr:DNA polymerase III subunit delta [Selenomonadales bacterium OttesenSCG-928-I06]